MPTATIQSVDYVNSFPSQYGDANGQLHCYHYAFEGGVEGNANHKAAPSWGPGDQVDYEIKGQHRGENKLKVGKPGSLRAFAGAPPAASSAPQGSGPPPARSAPSGGHSGPSAAINGQTVGMALNRATEWAIHAMGDDLGTKECHQWVYEQASNILRTAYLLEHGKVCKSGNWLADDVPMDYQQPKAKPQPGPEGAAFPPGSDEEADCPF